MGTWRTTFEFEVGNDPVALSRLHAAVTPRWLSFLPGLHVQIKHGRVRALVNAIPVAQPTRPIFRGHLVTDHAGTRIVGTLSWSLLKSYTLILVLLALGALYGTVAASWNHDQVDAISSLALASGVLLVAWYFRRDEARLRIEHEQRLRQELSAVLQ